MTYVKRNLSRDDLLKYFKGCVCSSPYYRQLVDMYSEALDQSAALSKENILLASRVNRLEEALTSRAENPFVPGDPVYCGFSLNDMLSFLQENSTSMRLEKRFNGYLLYVCSEVFGEFENTSSSLFNLVSAAFKPFAPLAKPRRDKFLVTKAALR